VLASSAGTASAVSAVTTLATNTAAAIVAVSAGKGSAVVALTGANATSPAVQSTSGSALPAVQATGKAVPAGGAVAAAGNAAALAVQGVSAFTGSGVVTIFARAALAGMPLLVQSAGRRDFSDAHDVARGIELALDLPADGTHRAYNVATGVGTTFRELANLLVELTGSRSAIEEHLAEPPGSDLVADISRAQAELGYSPCVGLREGLETYVQWLRNSA